MSSEDLTAGQESVCEQQEDIQQTEMGDTEKEVTKVQPAEPEEAPKFIEPAPPTMTIKEKMMQEEAKLKNKYPGLRVGGGSALLAKRLNQQKVKYFDSGDYNMAMAKKKSTKPAKPIVLEQETTGDAIPTPDTVPQRKLSLAQSRIPTGMLS